MHRRERGEREGTAQDEGGPWGFLIAPKAARCQDWRLCSIRPGESKPETDFLATTFTLKERVMTAHDVFIFIRTLAPGPQAEGLALCEYLCTCSCRSCCALFQTAVCRLQITCNDGGFQSLCEQPDFEFPRMSIISFETGSDWITVITALLVSGKVISYV